MNGRGRNSPLRSSRQGHRATRQRGLVSPLIVPVTRGDPTQNRLSCTRHTVTMHIAGRHADPLRSRYSLPPSAPLQCSRPREAGPTASMRQQNRRDDTKNVSNNRLLFSSGKSRLRIHVRSLIPAIPCSGRPRSKKLIGPDSSTTQWNGVYEYSALTAARSTSNRWRSRRSTRRSPGGRTRSASARRGSRGSRRPAR